MGYAQSNQGALDNPELSSFELVGLSGRRILEIKAVETHYCYLEEPVEGKGGIWEAP